MEEAGCSPDSPRNCPDLTYYQHPSSIPGNFQESKYSIAYPPVWDAAGLQKEN